MSIREISEERELQFLAPEAAKAAHSKGRIQDEPPCQIRTAYQRDRDRIVHSKAFRRLKHKTQVFLSPEGDHYRTRLTHTLEVSQISRTVARALMLNEDLTEAIALGHDLGHTPFGHCGEEVLNRIHPGGFEHNRQSLRVVDLLEKRKSDRDGLNLTYEVRDGILNHRGPGIPETLEGQIVKICDRIAYINHDIDDGVRAGVLHLEDLPQSVEAVFGRSHSERLNTMIQDLILTSSDRRSIRMSPERHEALLTLRDFMFEKVYLNPMAKKDESKAQRVLESLYGYFKENPEAMPEEYYESFLKNQSLESVKDYLAGMSDRYAINIYREIFLPKYWA